MLSVTGGVPRYLEELKPDLSAEANIKDLCFISGGLFVDEFERIFCVPSVSLLEYPMGIIPLKLRMQLI
jgi:hypothetical protein